MLAVFRVFGCVVVLYVRSAAALPDLCRIYRRNVQEKQGFADVFFSPSSKDTRSAQVHALVLQTRRASALACSCRYLLVAAGITAISPTDLTRCTCALRAWVARVPCKPATCCDLGFFSFFSSTKSALPLQERERKEKHTVTSVRWRLRVF